MAYLSVPSPGKWIVDIFGKKYVSTIFWARRRKAVRQGFDPELFMTEHVYQ